MEVFLICICAQATLDIMKNLGLLTSEKDTTLGVKVQGYIGQKF